MGVGGFAGFGKILAVEIAIWVGRAMYRDSMFVGEN